MATYVYKDSSCGRIEEMDLPMGSAPAEIMCGCGLYMHRVYLPTAISFRGSGFYKTDNPKTKHVRSSLKVGGNG